MFRQFDFVIINVKFNIISYSLKPFIFNIFIDSIVGDGLTQDHGINSVETTFYMVE